MDELHKWLKEQFPTATINTYTNCINGLTIHIHQNEYANINLKQLRNIINFDNFSYRGYKDNTDEYNTVYLLENIKLNPGKM